MPRMVAAVLVFVFMGIVFHLLQEDNPPAMFSSLLSYPWRRLQQLNQWIAELLTARGFNASARRVLGVELFGLGFTLMQIGEWALAVACWVLLGFLGLAKALRWGIFESDQKPPALVRFFSATGALVLCVLLITITVLRRPESEPWSNLVKLLRPGFAFPKGQLFVAIPSPPYPADSKFSHGTMSLACDHNIDHGHPVEESNFVWTIKDVGKAPDDDKRYYVSFTHRNPPWSKDSPIRILLWAETPLECKTLYGVGP